jgi:predicted Rossmann fold flavoprotein
MQEFDVVVIGAGASGMMCAIQAGVRNRKTCLLDHSNNPGAKISISGGGHCNFTNLCLSGDNYVSGNRHFCKSALARFSPQDFVRILQEHAIAFQEKKPGQLFCEGSAQLIVDLLMSRCKHAGAVFHTGVQVLGVGKDGGRFTVRSSRGDYCCESLVVATGGLSAPATGASGFGYDLARFFNINVVRTAPALVGMTLSGSDRKSFSLLAGLSLECVVSCNKAAFRDSLLFTHTGLSGPAVLQASLYWNPGDSLLIDLCPQQDLFQLLAKGKQSGGKTQLKNHLCDLLPRRFVEQYFRSFELERPLAEVSLAELQGVSRAAHTFQVRPACSGGFEKAEVTRGGVDTAELSPRTMESKRVSGLYFIGEVVDVTGQLGGYNLQWAWSSGYAAGTAV